MKPRPFLTRLEAPSVGGLPDSSRPRSEEGCSAAFLAGLFSGLFETLPGFTWLGFLVGLSPLSLPKPAAFVLGLSTGLELGLWLLLKSKEILHIANSKVIVKFPIYQILLGVMSNLPIGELQHKRQQKL